MDNTTRRLAFVAMLLSLAAGCADKRDGASPTRNEQKAFAAPHAPAETTIVVAPFEMKIPAKNFDVERFAMGIECREPDVYTFFIPLKVTKLPDDNYQGSLESRGQFSVPSAQASCYAALAAFTSIGDYEARADSNLYGVAISAQDLATRDIAGDLKKRLKTATLVGSTRSGSPRPFDAKFTYVDDPSADFCVRLLGRSYAVPFPTSVFASIWLGEFGTSTTDALSGRLFVRNGRGEGSVFYTCNNSTRSLTLDMHDPATTDAEHPVWSSKKLTATFSADLTRMTLSGAEWPLIRDIP